MHPSTREWWDRWVEIGTAAGFIALDWERLLFVAVLVDAFYRSESPLEQRQLSVEIRLNEKKMAVGLS